jgi:hypothetical protein
MNSPDDNDPLERLIDDTLHDLPLRQAPEQLQRRVLAAIADGASQPWWRKSFAHWPLPARVAFCMACLGLVKVAIDASMWLVTALKPPSLNIESTALVVGFKALVALHSSLANSIPLPWFYGALAALAVMYAAVFGIGAVAYRTLYAAR